MLWAVLRVSIMFRNSFLYSFWIWTSSRFSLIPQSAESEPPNAIRANDPAFCAARWRENEWHCETLVRLCFGQCYGCRSCVAIHFCIRFASEHRVGSVSLFNQPKANFQTSTRNKCSPVQHSNASALKLSGRSSPALRKCGFFSRERSRFLCSQTTRKRMTLRNTLIKNMISINFQLTFN